MVYAFKDFTPVIDDTSFIHPQACIAGNIIIGKNVYVGAGTSIHSGFEKIIIEDGCFIEDNCSIHTSFGITTWLKAGAHICCGAVINDAVIGKNCYVGINSVIMSNVELGDECMVDALSFIKAGEKIEGRKILSGNPAKIIQEVSDEMLAQQTKNNVLHKQLLTDMEDSLKACGPLEFQPSQDFLHKTWNAIKRNKLQ